MFNAETVSADERAVSSQIPTIMRYRQFSMIYPAFTHGCTKTDGKQMSIRIQSPVPLCRGAYPGPPDFPQNEQNRFVTLRPPVGCTRARIERPPMTLAKIQQLTPKLIQVCSTPGKHSVSLDGQPVFTGKTEIDCAAYLVKSVRNWPAAYHSTGPGIGQGFSCLSSFTLKLDTETNTPTMETRILKAAKKALVNPARRYVEFRTFFEHGQWWVEHLPSGAQWSVCDASGPSCPDGFDFELVTQGDEE
jgi:hypothetical protein